MISKKNQHLLAKTKKNRDNLVLVPCELKGTHNLFF